MRADRDLLLGLLALQTGLIDHTALMAAFHAWTREKARPLADQLVALGYLDAAHRPLLEGLASTIVDSKLGRVGRMSHLKGFSITQNLRFPGRSLIPNRCTPP